MNIFKDYTMPWYDMGILKWTVLFIGIYVGATWPDFFAGWTNILLLLGVIGLIYLIGKYWKEMFGGGKKPQEEHTI